MIYESKLIKFGWGGKALITPDHYMGFKALIT